MYIVRGEGQLPFWQPLPARARSRVDAALKNTSPPPRDRSDKSWICCKIILFNGTFGNTIETFLNGFIVAFQSARVVQSTVIIVLLFL